jgi:hypothetical protein
LARKEEREAMTKEQYEAHLKTNGEYHRTWREETTRGRCVH